MLSECDCFFVRFSVQVYPFSISLLLCFNFINELLLHFNFLLFYCMHFCNETGFTLSIFNSLLSSFLFLTQLGQSSFNLFLIMCHHFEIISSFHHLSVSSTNSHGTDTCHQHFSVI